MRIFKTKSFHRFTLKNNIDDLTLSEAIERAERGLIDANLGADIIKQRIARKGQSRSKGFRTIIVIKHEEKAFFVYGFAKSEKDNLRQDEEEQFKNMAKHLLSLSEDYISKLLRNGDFVEVRL